MLYNMKSLTRKEADKYLKSLYIYINKKNYDTVRYQTDKDYINQYLFDNIKDKYSNLELPSNYKDLTKEQKESLINLILTLKLLNTDYIKTIQPLSELSELRNKIEDLKERIEQLNKPKSLFNKIFNFFDFLPI